MADKISVYTPVSTVRRVTNILLIGLIGFTLWQIPSALRSISSGITSGITAGNKKAERESKTKNLDYLITSSKFEEAKGLLEQKKDNPLTQLDISLYSKRIGEKEAEQKKANETVAKKKAEEDLKTGKIARCMEFINKYQFPQATNAYGDIVSSSKLFTEETINDLRLKIANINPDNLLKDTQEKVGEERINAIEKLVSCYPTHAKVQELKRTELDTYLSTLQAHFSTSASDAKTSSFIKQFRLWAMQNKDLLKGRDLSELLSQGKAYAQTLNTTKPDILYSGDRVRVVRLLGELRERDKDTYYHGGTTNDVPLGTEARIRETIPSGVIQIKVNGKVSTLDRREVEPLGNSYAPQVLQELQALETLLNPLGGK